MFSVQINFNIYFVDHDITSPRLTSYYYLNNITTSFVALAYKDVQIIRRRFIDIDRQTWIIKAHAFYYIDNSSLLLYINEVTYAY